MKIESVVIASDVVQNGFIILFGRNLGGMVAPHELIVHGKNGSGLVALGLFDSTKFERSRLKCILSSTIHCCNFSNYHTSSENVI